MREAVVRRGLLRGSLSEKEAQDFLSQQPDDYIVSVRPSDLPFGSISENALPDFSYLELQPSQRKVMPKRIGYIRKGGRIREIRLHFPRLVEGKAIIASTEKKVKFLWDVEPKPIKVTFDLGKMARDGKPDL
jgi:hypothetical protein